MAEVVERLDGVERRLSSVETGLSKLSGEVHKLRILGEQNTVQHGLKLDDHARKLEEIATALEPLARLDAFVRLVADEHEKFRLPA